MGLRGMRRGMRRGTLRHGPGPGMPAHFFQLLRAGLAGQLGVLLLPAGHSRSLGTWRQCAVDSNCHPLHPRPRRSCLPRRDATYTRILKLEPSIPSHLSDQAKGFIRQALKKDPSQRPTVHQMLRHPWLRTYQVGRGCPGPLLRIVEPGFGMCRRSGALTTCNA